jgi:shikimate dehydrogenase
MDLIYNPPVSRLLREAAASGCQVQNGELMLLHQGAAAFTLWTGQPAPVALMHERLAEGLAAVGADVGGAADEGAGTAGAPGA